MSVFEGPKLSEMSITDRMRANLAPKGSMNVSYIHLSSNHFDYDFIMKCINELDAMQIRSELGMPPTNLEKLAFMLLCDSAYIEPHHDDNSAINL